MVQEAARVRPPEPGRAGVRHYAIAMAAAAAGITLKVTLARELEAPFILAYPAVAVAAILGGLGPGLLATVLSALGTWLWVIHPVGSFGAPDAADFAAMLLFVALGAFVSVLADRSRKASARVAQLERESVVRAVEVRARAYVDGAPLAIFVVDGRGRYVDFNPAALAMLGVDAATLLQMSIADVIPPEQRDRALAEFGGLVQTGRLEQEYELLRPDGRPIQVLLRAVRVGEDRYVAFCQDFTERRRAEAELRESEGRFAVAFQGSPVAMAIAEASTGKYVEVNPAFLEASGYCREEVLGRNAADLELYCDPADRERVLLAIRSTERPPAEEIRFRSRDGRTGTCLVSIRKFQLHGEPHLLSTVVDVTARKQAEDERAALQARLGMASRMAALGTLVSGVAHEVNNPLAIVTASQGSALEEVRALQEAARRGASPDPGSLERIAEELLEMLVDASTGAERIARIVKDLTVFGRPDPRRTRVRLGDVVEGALKWLPSSVASRADVAVSAQTAPDVLASAGQLEQVIVNLITNAALAIPEGRRGRIAVRTGGGPGSRVRLEVEDDGSGIPPELMERIFEPFFTTRGVGKGTGLGLPICHAIVEAHGGSLEVRSAPGVGSTFRIDLPAAGTLVEQQA